MAKNKKPHAPKKGFNPAVRVMKYAGMDRHVIQMFAAFAIALKECVEFGGQPISNDDVEELLAKTQEEWNWSIINNYDIADKCATMYDIDVRRAGNGQN